MLHAFSLVWYLKGLCAFVLYVLLLNAELVFATSVDEYDCVFIVNSLDLRYRVVVMILASRTK